MCERGGGRCRCRSTCGARGEEKEERRKPLQVVFFNNAQLRPWKPPLSATIPTSSACVYGSVFEQHSPSSVLFDNLEVLLLACFKRQSRSETSLSLLTTTLSPINYVCETFEVFNMKNHVHNSSLKAIVLPVSAARAGQIRIVMSCYCACLLACLMLKRQRLRLHSLILLVTHVVSRS